LRYSGFDCCAIAGTFVILRGLAFIGDALAHGAARHRSSDIDRYSGHGGRGSRRGVHIGALPSLHSAPAVLGHGHRPVVYRMLSLGVVIVSRSNSFTET